MNKLGCVLDCCVDTPARIDILMNCVVSSWDIYETVTLFLDVFIYAPANSDMCMPCVASIRDVYEQVEVVIAGFVHR